MKRNNSIMNFNRLQENKKSNEHDTSSYLLTKVIATSQNPYWHTRHDGKSNRQQLTTVNNSEQPGFEKGPRSGTKPHHTTARIYNDERED
jgi:hypothetical protein